MIQDIANGLDSIFSGFAGYVFLLCTFPLYLRLLHESKKIILEESLNAFIRILCFFVIFLIVFVMSSAYLSVSKLSFFLILLIWLYPNDLEKSIGRFK